MKNNAPDGTSSQRVLIPSLVVVLLGGLLWYYIVPGRHLAIDEMHFETMEHRDGDEVAPYEIYPGDVVEKLRRHENIILLDVRTSKEYEELHLQSARLLPVQQLSQQSLNEIGLGDNAKDREIYIYCRSGVRSKTAYDIMSSLGYTNIRSVAGGMIHWEEDGYPFTETGANTGYMMTDDDGVTMDDRTGPQITFDRTSYDFGIIPQYGGAVDATFTIANAGEETLVLGDITTSCSCTSAAAADTSIAPGANTILTVTFDPDFHTEPLDKGYQGVIIKV